MSIKNNTTDLRELLEVANSLPVAENLDSELTTQDDLIAQIASALEGKSAPSVGGGVEYEIITIPAGSTATTYPYTLPRVTGAYGGVNSSMFYIGWSDGAGTHGEQILSIINNA